MKQQLKKYFNNDKQTKQQSTKQNKHTHKIFYNKIIREQDEWNMPQPKKSIYYEQHINMLELRIPRSIPWKSQSFFIRKIIVVCEASSYPSSLHYSPSTFRTPTKETLKMNYRNRRGRVWWCLSCSGEGLIPTLRVTGSPNWLFYYEEVRDNGRHLVLPKTLSTKSSSSSRCWWLISWVLMYSWYACYLKWINDDKK